MLEHPAQLAWRGFCLPAELSSSKERATTDMGITAGWGALHRVT